MGNVEQNLARVICAFILHISVMPEIYCAINLMRFTRNNSEGFYGKQSFFPFSVALMKLMGGFMTEYSCVLIIVQSNNIENVIKDFIAFGFICEIDDIIMQTVNLIDCVEEINKAGISVPIEQHIQSYTMVYKEIWKEKNNHTLQVKIMLTIQMII